ncbi:MFS transporter [Candidatus Woesebacteria bacterium]|nr:MFS transporter [Candidatus Woesebacteria bacterium]
MRTLQNAYRAQEDGLAIGPFLSRLPAFMTMKLIPYRYFELLSQRDFFILNLVMFLFQAATSFILLGLIASVFGKTGSNIGVSGVIVSFSVPGFLLFAIAGLAADLIDRKKIIVAANVVEVLIIFLILANIEFVYASIGLSFLYFAANAFYLPAASAATAQMVKRSQLLAANSVFIFTIAGGQLSGFAAAAIIHLFLGSVWTLLVCEVITVLTVWLATQLPPLLPRKNAKASLFGNVVEVLKGFSTIFGRKLIWFYFVMFAFMQGLIAFGVTLGPGFFDEVVGLSFDRGAVFSLPLVSLGVVLGAIFVHTPKLRESQFIAIGMGLIGVTAMIFGLILKLGLFWGRYILLPLAFFVSALGFGVIITMIASRAVLQKRISHSSQGTVFGALVVLAAFFAGVMSPFAVGLEAIFGYINILILGGVGFVGSSFVLEQVGRRWKF